MGSFKVKNSVESDYYVITETKTFSPADTTYKFETHEYYELLLFLEGDAKFIVENKTYTLEPGDVILIRRHELHRLSLNRSTPYHRIVLWIFPELFQQFNCEEYEAQFIEIVQGEIDNKIPAKVVKASGLYDAFMEFKKYSEEYTMPWNTPILRATIIKMLYLLNNTIKFSAPDYSKSPMEPVILFLNTFYTEDVTLEMLEKKFFLTKNHLCKAFRKATGITIFDYIRKKRLSLVQEKVEGGMRIGDAARIAGFHDYSAFYRAYKKEFGVAPKKALTQKK